MKKYRCKICGHIYDDSKENIKFEDLPSDFVCPKCGVPKDLFEEVEEQEIVQEKKQDNFNRVEINNCNVSITRIEEKCINCGICKNTCIKREGMKFDSQSELCINCGQCVQSCPTKALTVKNDINEFLSAKKEGKILIAYTSPSTRVAFGDIFNLEKGAFTQKKLVGFFKRHRIQLCT